MRKPYRVVQFAIISGERVDHAAGQPVSNNGGNAGGAAISY